MGSRWGLLDTPVDIGQVLKIGYKTLDEKLSNP